MHRTWPIRILAAIRIVNGVLALVMPALFARQMQAPTAEAAAQYPFRLFGVRAVVNGLELIQPTLAQRWLPEVTVVVHASDLAAAALATGRGDVSRSFGRRTMALSGLNTVLAVIGWTSARRVRR